MLTRVLTMVPILASSEDPMDPFNKGFEAPVGCEVTGVIFAENALQLILHLAPNAVRVFHPVLVMGVGMAIDLPIGGKIGRCFGTQMIPTSDGPRLVQIFQWGEWPTSTIMAAKPQGVA